MAIPDLLASSVQLQSLPGALIEALEPLLERAPAAVFPRARRLYFDKYPLEGRPQDFALDPVDGRFFTFVLRESIHDPGTSLSAKAARPAANQLNQADSCKLHELAVVYWQQPEHAPLSDVKRYLMEQWKLEPASLEVVQESWFRQGGPWVRVTLPGADPAPLAVDPETSS